MTNSPSRLVKAARALVPLSPEAYPGKRLFTIHFDPDAWVEFIAALGEVGDE